MQLRINIDGLQYAYHGWLLNDSKNKRIYSFQRNTVATHYCNHRTY